MASQMSVFVAMCLLLGVAACGVVLAAPAPAGWGAPLRRASQGQRVPLLIAVSHRVTAKMLEETCMAVSDPSSTQYGKYLNQQELTNLIADEGNVETVLAWLRDAGISNDAGSDCLVTVGAMRDFVSVEAPVYAVEQLLGVALHEYRVPAAVAKGTVVPAGAVIVRTEDAVVLPPHVDAAVDVVVGVSEWHLPQRRGIVTDMLQQGSDAVEAAAPAVATSLRGAAPVKPAPPMVPIFEFTNDRIFLGFADMAYNASAGPNENSYEANLVMDGTTHASFTFAAKDCTSLAALGSPLMLYNTTQHAKPYTAYNMTMVTITPDGARSDPTAMAFDWSTLPKDYQGVVSRPSVTPADYAKHYGLDTASSAMDKSAPGAAAATQSVAEFYFQFMNVDDLMKYQKMFDIEKETPVIFNGPNNQSDPGIEAQMDVELIEGVAQDVQTTFWSIGCVNMTNCWMLQFAKEMSDAANPPLVTSISYGGPETASTPNYISRTNTEFLKLCTRGLTIMVASGDAGVSNSGHGGSTCGIIPDWPASSPWITSVSATATSPRAAPRSNGATGEVAVSITEGTFWTTGGGFSNLADQRRPAYQNTAVKQYLTTDSLPPATMFNQTGRGYPDVSSIGTTYWMIIDRVAAPIGAGTSAASPTFAGIVTRLNQARLAAGKPPMGFINPLLYSLAESNPEVFYDVTLGNNRCAEYTCCQEGFPATKGWDAVTGLGSVGDFDALRKLVLNA